ncbi:MAG TPA: cytochrome b N-terminal domain-containing protein [Burkholderiales bacterium]|nr:cytochrome b N-terminal domain-containing protein [Burkholderiales bacterium]
MLKRIQGLAQWCFVRVEGLFNLAFGEKLNPLYHIGQISYYLMWLIVASGLYLYAFFETSVAGAPASVDALTHGQPWAGGVLRSVHRYASDGVVLTMLLHMARHWAFDRYRGFRWFSWVSGVVLLWLVYVAGINGYMLPWDRLAKFTVIATAEWFDWLPVFNGTLVRNFIFEENVNDRLFSLLSFIHIGVPLAVLAILWVHTQRVPQARTSPPLPIMLVLTAALILLSALKPAVSQTQESFDLGFDWFYLPVLALLYRWTPGEVWLLVGAGSALLFLLPWLPPKKRGVERYMLVRPDNRIVAVRQGETLLDAGLREGIALPFDCRNGGCGECKATLRSGSVDFGAYQPGVLTSEEHAAGKILPCVCTPREDVELEYIPATAPGAAAQRPWFATVESLQRLSPDVMQVILKLDGGERIAFYAGQYINILLDDGAKRSFSFATAPAVNDRIELHIRRIPGGRYTTHVFERMRPGDRVRFEGPLGSFFLREAEKPMIFVAGSTGFAPVKSMLEYAFSRGVKRRMLLYWGVRRPADLYLRELPEKWAREHENFSFVPVISHPAPEDRWSGRTGLVHEAILADFPDLGGYQVYACGSAAMVEAAHPAFKAQGLGPDDCFSDAFVPRAAPEMARLGGAA